VVVPLHWLFFYTAASDSPPLWALVSGLALADLGLASVGALVAARHNPALRAFRQRLITAGKPKLVAIIAVARKLLTILNAVLRDKRPWRDVDEEHAHAKP